MDDDVNKTAEVIDDEDLDTTAPGSPEPSVWQMPEPVFRRTSGKLAPGFEKSYLAAGPGSDNAAPLTDSVDDPNPTPYVEPTPRNPTVKLVLVLLGVAAMIAFIAVFLTVVYFFFLRAAPEA